MLVLSRKNGEELVIGSGDTAIRIVVRIKGNRAQLSVDAPKELSIRRLPAVARSADRGGDSLDAKSA